MKSMKNSFGKRILIFFCCTVFLTLSVFMSYDNTLIVKAVDDDVLLKDAAIVCLSGLGLILSGPTVGAVVSILGPEMLALGMDVKDYITQNEDGTTTISEDFVNLVLQAYKEYTVQNFDGNIQQDESTMYYVYGGAEYNLHTPSIEYKSIVNKFTYAYPVAFLFVDNNEQYKYVNWGKSNFDPASDTKGYGCFVFAYNGNKDSSNGGIFFASEYSSLFGKDTADPLTINYVNGDEKQRMSNYISFTPVSGGSRPLNASYYASVSTSGIPVYTSFDMMREDFYSGNYTHADNYGGNLGQTTSYTGTYGGGDINVSTEKLNGIQDKLNEINETDKSIDDKLKDLLEWLGINVGSGDIKPGGTDFKSLLDMLSSYFNAVIMRLDAIIQGIDGLLWFESNDDGEEDPTNDLADMLKKILDNPETGSQEVADSLSASFSDVAAGLTKKFPFSIPWDIYSLFSVFANISASHSQFQTASVCYDDRGYMLYSDLPADTMMPLAEGDPSAVSYAVRGSGDAPYFELPIVVQSFGIDEVIIVDLEGFTSLSTFSRTMFSLIFGMLLIKWTVAFISAINEVMPDFFSD